MINSFWPVVNARAVQGLSTVVTPKVKAADRMWIMARKRWKCDTDTRPCMACKPATRAATGSVNDAFSLRKRLEFRQGQVCQN